MNDAMYRPNSLVAPKRRRRRLFMSFEMVRLDRAAPSRYTNNCIAKYGKSGER